jgi:adenine-specific DNA-methyltransferase
MPIEYRVQQAKRDEKRQELQRLLRKLFQFDYADLDFGIYRILNQKRGDIERFIERDLLNAVEEGLGLLAEAERDEATQQMAELREELGAESFEADGSFKPGALEEALQSRYPRVREAAQAYQAALAQARQSHVAEETQARIFDDLYTFFTRYYDQGDFVSKRRYGWRDSKFYVPYNGEEVLLHWANRDQYYIKSSEQFVSYRFSPAPEFRVEFHVVEVDVPANNEKGDSRYFVLHEEEPLRYEPDAQVLTVQWEYRPLKEEETSAILAAHNAIAPREYKTLDRTRLNVVWERRILEALPAEAQALRDRLAAPNKPNADASVLAYHLNQYTARNTMDYFIHKGLGRFLRRELDFYLKNEVLRLDDVIDDPEADTLRHALRRVRVVRNIAERIIAFLAQIEEFQKRLWEKKKFVIETQYMVTLDRVPEAFYAEIVTNEAQLRQWEQVYAVEQWPKDLLWQGEWSEAALRNHPYLMLDTAFFDEEFKWRLLGHFEDVDGATDGVLIHGDNFQALNLMLPRYEGQVKAIYIDPPYNTGEGDFIYKDDYYHSSWLAMMDDRLSLAARFLPSSGTIAVSIDDEEQERLHILMEQIFGSNNWLANLVWDKNRKNDATFFSIGHEYMVVFARDKGLLRDTRTRFREPKEGVGEARSEYDRLRRVFQDDWEQVRKGWFAWFENIPRSDPKRRLMRYSKVGPLGPFRDDGNINWPGGGGPRYTILHPVTKKPVRKPISGWRYPTPERFWEEHNKGRIVFGPDETTVPSIVSYLFGSDEQVMPSVFYSYAQTATQEFEQLFTANRVFDNPKNWKDILRLAAYLSSSDDTVMDFFAGSGTTAHAVMNLNRQGQSKHKYILVEQASYFDDILRPRIQKVAASANWSKGIPQDRNGLSHMVRYQRMESYDDALNNIRVEEPEGEQRRFVYQEWEDYMLHYMLPHETRHSPTLLAQETFTDPFGYTLHIQQGNVRGEDTPVDLIATFHYLLGMHVERLQSYQHQERPYRVSRGIVRTSDGTERVVVIWRNTEGLDQEAEAAWAEETLALDETVQRVYTNGASLIPRAVPLEITFRERMEGSTDAA